MRRSPLRHSVAVLRTTLGLTQTGLGELTGRAARTIQSVELGTLPLSGDLALSIAEATGIDAGWLLEGDPDAPPRKGLTAQHVAPGPGPYTRDDYETHRALMESPVASWKEAEAEIREAGKTRNPQTGTVRTSVRTMKRALLSARRQMLQEGDRQTVEALRRLLDQTVLRRTGNLVRWKVRQFLRTLAEENEVRIELPTGIRATFSHVYQADEARPRAAKSGPKPSRRS